VVLNFDPPIRKIVPARVLRANKMEISAGLVAREGLCYFWRNRSSTSDSTYKYLFLCSVVCLSVVCRICAPCLHHSTDFGAILQVQLWGPVTRARWGLLLPRRFGELWGVTSTSSSQNMQLLIAAASWRIQSWSWVGPAILCFTKLLWCLLLYVARCVCVRVCSSIWSLEIALNSCKMAPL